MKVLNTSVYNEIPENTKTNKLALVCYLISNFVLSAALIQYYWSTNENIPLIEPIAFFVCIFAPWVGAWIACKRKPNMPYIRMHIMASIIICWLLLVFTGKPDVLAYLMAPMLAVSIGYSDVKFTVTVSIAAVLMGLVDIIQNAIRYGWKDDKSIVSMTLFMITLLLALFLIGAIHMIQYRKQRINDRIELERERFKAIVSVGITRIFEYVIKEDKFMITSGASGEYGKENYILNFSSVAKRHNYVFVTDWSRFDELMRECIEGNGIVEKELRLKDSDDEFRWYRIRGRVIFDNNGDAEKVIGSMENIDEQKRSELSAEDEKKRDTLTKLYRRPFVDQKVNEFLQNKGGQDAGHSGLLLLDIDDFTNFVDKMGGVFGDEILKNIAGDIQKLFYDSDIIGRVGSDEFVVLMKNVDTLFDVENKALEIQKVIANTYVGETKEHRATVSIGVALYPDNGKDYESLYNKAEMALCLAKTKGNNHYDIYDDVKDSVYSILADDIAARRKKRLEEETHHNHVSDSLIETAFKLIEESKDTDSAINLLIRQISRQIDIDGVIIKTRNANDTSMTIAYSFGTEEYKTGEGKSVIKYTEKQWNDMHNMYGRDDGMFVCNNFGEAPNETVKHYMLAYGIESCAGCCFYENGNLVGVIDFLDFKKERIWSDDDIYIMRAVTSIVSSYLLKMKAYEDASETVERLTGYDSLTGLYKYEKFIEVANEYIGKHPGRYAIICADICHFKYLNDTYGYKTGDMILRRMADNIREYNEWFVYGSRIHSDNIVALARIGSEDIEEMRKSFDKARTEFSNVIKRELADSRVEPCLGICVFETKDNIIIQDAISDANMARKKAKEPDSPRCLVYDSQMGISANNALIYEKEMGDALDNHEFMIYLQPKVNLSNNRIEGAEALVRWKKPDGKMIFPNDFIPVFEKNRSIVQLDYYVYEETCKYLRERLDKGLNVIGISVNVSRVHLYSCEEFIERVKNLIDKYSIPPELLEFELTETSFMDRVDDTIELLSRLRELGTKVSLDDFGSGYSSLNVLTKLPLDILKIDKEFLRDFENDSDEKIIIPSVIDMAKKLKLRVVCEGTETIEQIEFLREVGCDFAQGYYYSKPVPQEEFDEMLAKQL